VETVRPQENGYAEEARRKVAVITGATRGMALASVKLFVLPILRPKERRQTFGRDPLKAAVLPNSSMSTGVGNGASHRGNDKDDGK